jgi:hypothetical protein
LAQTSCGCLKPVDIDGKSWSDNESIRVRFGFLPNSEQFQQSCKLSGNVEGIGRCDIGTLTIAGKVVPPIRLSQSSFTLDEVQTGKTIKVKLTSENGVLFDIQEVKIGTDNVPLRIRPGHDNVSLEFEFEANADFRLNQMFPLVFPLKFEGKPYQFTVPIKLVTETIEVSPRVLVFRNKRTAVVDGVSGGSVWHAKFVVRGNGIQIQSDRLQLGLASRNTLPKSPLKQGEVKCRQVNSSVVLIELFLSENELRADEDEVVLMTSNNVDACRIPFIMN